MQVIHDEAGAVIGVILHGTRYSPEALSAMAAACERMRPVVEAAVAWVDAAGVSPLGEIATEGALLDAVAAYREGEGAK